MSKPKAHKNLAKDVETPKIKLKHIDIPNAARVEIARMNQNFDNYVAGMAAGMGIKGRWSFDMKSNKIIVEDKEK